MSKARATLAAIGVLAAGWNAVLAIAHVRDDSYSVARMVHETLALYR